MTTNTIKERLQSASIFFAEDSICGHQSVIGYEKKFQWKWMATQMNTFIVCADLGPDQVTVELFQEFLEASFEYATKNYSGWPRGFQSGMAAIAILISENITQEAKDFCTELKAGKKFAGFSVPVAVDSKSKEVFLFKKNPMWGGIYYPHFRKMVEEFTG